MIAEVCQRWRLGRCSWRPAGEPFDARSFEVAVIRDDTTARCFVVEHHREWAPRFWERVERSGGEGSCWTWMGSTLPKGYGRFYPAFKVGLYAHRFSWELANGRAVPAGLVVMHSCDNPRCVNPAHLSVGTYSDNILDAVRKGRHRPPIVVGGAHPNAKLTAADVAEIRRRVGAGETHRSVGRAFGVSKTTVQFIANGRAWRSLPNPSLACPEVLACCA